jgi:hypothetical protein
MITEFLEAEDYEEVAVNKGFTQRIILIAANFRKEVTSTVLWLLNFKLRVQCFLVTPYSMGEQHFVNIEQIIPTKDAEEFMIGLADKALDEIDGATEEKNRHRVGREFWAKLIGVIATKTNRFKNISPGTKNWIQAASGVRGVYFNFVAGRAYGRVELYIDRGDKEENKFIFDQLYAKKESIEAAFKKPITWQRLDDRRACRIKCETPGNIFDPDQWPTLVEFMTDAMVRMENAFKEPLANINQELQKREKASPAPTIS